MKRTVPSRPLSPIRPGRSVPFAGTAALGAVDVGVGGWIGVITSFGETSFGDGLLPFDSRPLPFAAGFGRLGAGGHRLGRGSPHGVGWCLAALLRLLVCPSLGWFGGL